MIPTVLLLSALAVAPPPPATPTLERALGVIRADHIEADLRFIAADELQGRDTPSEGLRIAARFIRARLDRLGFTPAGDEGFFDLYEMSRVKLDVDDTFVELRREDGTTGLDLGDDYYFHSEGFVDLDVGGPVVFVGEGTASELARANASGRWVLAFDSMLSGRTLVDNATRAGALGIVVAKKPGDSYARTDRRARRARRQGRMGVLRVSADTLPVLHLTSDGEDRLDVDLGDLEPGAVLPFTLRDRRSLEGGAAETFELENVAGLWTGSDPRLGNEVIVLSAHYDHVGVDGEDVYNGADDNGSGTCALLAVAEALHEYGPLRRSVLLLWVSGEEKGLKGSYAWTVAPTLPEGYRAVCNLNVDMVGRNAPDYLLVTPSKARPEYNELVRMAEKFAPLEGFGELGSCDEYWRRSDHMNFAENLKIPVAFLFSDVHEDYHKPTDTVDKVNFDKVERVSRLLMRIIDGLQGDQLDF